MSLNLSGHNISDIYVGNSKIDKVFVGEDLVYSQIAPDVWDPTIPFYAEVVSSDSTAQVGFRHVQADTLLETISTLNTEWFPNVQMPDLYYSYDNNSWQQYTPSTLMEIGGDHPNRIYFKTNTSYTSAVWFGTYRTSDKIATTYNAFCNFYAQGSHIRVRGNIHSLLRPEFDTDLSLFFHAFDRLFSGCSYLESAFLKLPATTLSYYCYEYMFYGCTSLTSAPELPATTLANYCYFDMFRDCSFLTSAPVLPATTLANYCYSNMFHGCWSLTSAPVLPATTLADYCYSSMFSGCTALTSAPVLPVTTLADYCYYQMFYGCTSLTSAPELPATALSAGCYNGMFYSCTALTSAPVLPATTLANQCYAHMFAGCTSLTSLPKLPALTLVSDCYFYMFQDVLASSTQTATCRYQYRVPYTGTGTAGTDATSATNHMFKDEANPDATTGFWPSINTVFYTQLPVQ